MKNAKSGKYYYCHLRQRAGKAHPPSYHVIDCRRHKMNHCGLSQPLITAMKNTLARGEQVLLFINRRGYAPVFMCQSCGYIADCHDCDSHLTVHQEAGFLQCHHCGYRTRASTQCPSCHQATLAALGVGTQRVEKFLQENFKETPIYRIDRDSTRTKGAFDRLRTEIARGHPSILVGTQMLAKGHHFAKVTMVGIINADNGLFNPDFRSSEHFGQLLLQVAGRAGRAELPGHVYCQTLHPDNPLLQALLERGYQTFAEQLLTERKLAELPPYTHIAILRGDGKNAKAIEYYLEQLKKKCLQARQPAMILGPVPAILTKKAGKYRFHLWCQADQRQSLGQAISFIEETLQCSPPGHGIKVYIEIDPLTVV